MDNHKIILAFSDGVLWMWTYDEETANEWLEEGKIDLWRWYECYEEHSR